VTIAVTTRLLVYATTCASLPILRWRKSAPQAAYLISFGIVLSAVSLILIVWLLTNVDYRKEGLPILISAGIGFVLYFINRLTNNGKNENKNASEI
jgi:amino acid transporter